MIARTVRRHRPQSAPAPQASAICLDVDAPEATSSETVWLVTPVHRQTNITAPVLRLERRAAWEFRRLGKCQFPGMKSAIGALRAVNSAGRSPLPPIRGGAP